MPEIALNPPPFNPHGEKGAFGCPDAFLPQMPTFLWQQFRIVGHVRYQLTRRRRSGQHRSQRNAEPLHLLKFDLVPFQASDCAAQRFDLLKYSHTLIAS